MKDFILKAKKSPFEKAIIRVDAIDDDINDFTVLYMDGVKGSVFEKYITWGIGSVISENEINELVTKIQPIASGFNYKESEVETLGVEEFKLSITPAITNGTKAKVAILCENAFGSYYREEVELEDGSVTEVEIIKGFKYKFETVGSGDSWTEEPSDFTCSANKNVTLKVTIPAELTKYKMTITPTITDATTASIVMKGTKSDYENIEVNVELEDGVEKEVDIYEGYSYDFELSGNDTWTSGSAPDVIVCDGNETAALGITVVA